MFGPIRVTVHREPGYFYTWPSIRRLTESDESNGTGERTAKSPETTAVLERVVDPVVALEDGRARVVFEMPQPADVRSVVEGLEERRPATDVVSFRRGDGAGETREEFVARLDGRSRTDSCGVTAGLPRRLLRVAAAGDRRGTRGVDGRLPADVPRAPARRRGETLPGVLRRGLSTDRFLAGCRAPSGDANRPGSATRTDRV